MLVQQQQQQEGAVVGGVNPGVEAPRSGVVVAPMQTLRRSGYLSNSSLTAPAAVAPLLPVT